MVQNTQGDAQRTGALLVPQRLNRIDALKSYDWPKNNVRELRNAIERMLIAVDGEVISLEQVPLEIRGDSPPTDGDAGSFQRLRSR